MSKKSKQVEQRIQTSEYVMTAATTHRDQIAEALANRAAVAQGANTLITKTVAGALIDFLVADLKLNTTWLDAAEMRVVTERADDVGLRETRDAATSQLQVAAVRVRSMVLDALGPVGLSKYGLEGDTPRITRDLVVHAQSVVQLMTAHPFHVTVDGVTFDSAALAANLQTKADAVEKSLADLQREEQELVNELGNRHNAIADWVDVHQGVADTLTGLFRLAGRKDLSERVRPSPRALAGEEAPPAEPPATPATPT